MTCGKIKFVFLKNNYSLAILLWYYNKVLFLGYMHPKSTQKIPCYKRYKNSRNFLDEKAICQPWIIKKKPNFG
jgi:hypothetical protein